MAFGRRRGAKPRDDRLYVTTDSTRPLLDPPLDVIRSLVLGLARDVEDFVSVARAHDQRGTFVQVMIRPDGRCIVETRAGSDDSFAHAVVPDLVVAADVILLWSADDHGWRTAVDWQDG